MTDKTDSVSHLDGKLFADMVRGGAAYLRSNAQAVNDLNVFPVPDGDTGDNMSMTIESGVNALERMTSAELGEIANQLAQGMLLGARGNSGVILSQLFAGMAKCFSGRSIANVSVIGEALTEGVKAAYAAVLSPTEGTILTVAREATDYAVSRITPASTVATFFSDLITEMSASLKRTPEILAVLKEAGVIDSGGAGLFYVMEGFNRTLRGEVLPETEAVAQKPAATKADTGTFDEYSELEYGYCTEFLLQLQVAKCDPSTFDMNELRTFLQTIGDSIVAFQTGTIVKVHVHTKTPEQVLGYCRKFGEFLTVKIENMSVQHSQTKTTADKPDASTEAAQEITPQVRKPYAVVAVACGDGIRQTFLSLGVDRIVNGGQTMNPSAQDFLDAFKTLQAEVIFVLPNNSNILLAANQAARIYTDAAVIVLPSKSIGDGYAAMSVYDPNAQSTEDLFAMMKEAMTDVCTGCITTSVRDANLNGVEIHTGDWIGFMGKQMLVANTDALASAKALLEKMHAPKADAITVFCGADAPEDEITALKAFLAESTDAEVFCIQGGQEVYRYIFVVE